MGDTNVSRSTTTDLKSVVKDFTVTPMYLESPFGTTETTYDSPKWSEWLGYYKTIPELKKAIDALAIWTCGKGYEADTATRVRLQRIRGNGKEDVIDVLINAFAVAATNGDSFCEIIMDEDDNLRNLKPLNPQRVRIVYTKEGIIDRYEQLDRPNGSKIHTWKPEQIFHVPFDRVGDEIHGTGIPEVCKWVIDARNEAMSDKRRVHHRSTIRVIEVDADKPAKLTALRQEYEQAIKNGEVLLVPKGNVGFPQAPIEYLDTIEWIKYLEGFFYQAAGIPRVIATSQEYTEAGSKVGYLTFEPIYTRRQLQFEAQILNQLGFKLTFNRPASLSNTMQESEQANTGQTSFQPNETTVTAGRNE